MVRLCARVIVVLSMLVVAGTSVAAAPPDPVADNAALHYWRAFSVIPNLSDAQDAAVDQLLDKLGPANALASGAIAGSSAAMKELHRGAKSPRCVWATPLEDGPAALLPHCGKARQLARLACARAHLNFQLGRPAEAIDDLADAMTLGRHAGNEGILVAVLVDYAIEARAIRVAARHLGELKPADLQDLAARIERLPPATTMRRAMQSEKQWLLEWLIQNLSDPAKKGTSATMLRDLVDSDDTNLKALSGVPPKQVRDGAIALRPIYDQVADMMDLPPAQMKDPESLLAGLSPTARSLGMGLLPAAMKCRQREVDHQTQLAMFKAAIAVVRGGPGELKAESLKDPFAGGPFSYEKTAGGFRLVSKTLDREGKPLTLEVGRTAKQ